MLATKLSLWRNNCNLVVTSLKDSVKEAQGIFGRNEVSQGKNLEGFVRQLTENQTRLYGYVFSLLGDHARASDVVQETNLVLWRKIDEFRPEKPFLPWAYAIARFQVLAHLRDTSRDRLLLDEELAEAMSSEAGQKADELESLRFALRPCLELLTDTNRQLIRLRYLRELPIAEVAAQVGRSVGAIKVALLRVRRQLAECAQKRLAEVQR